MLPPELALPVLRGPLRGYRWVIGSAPRGVLFGLLEHQQLTHFMSHVRATSVVWDVGANVGLYTLAAARRAAEVVAFEPLPRNVALLRRHVAMNRLTNVQIVEAAVGRNDGEARLAEGDSPSEARVSDAGAITVAAVSLDGWVARTQARLPDAVKIDVEGAELQVLLGAARSFAHRPIIQLAVHGDALAGECLQWLEQRGYRVAGPNGEPARTASEWIAIPADARL